MSRETRSQPIIGPLTLALITADQIYTTLSTVFVTPLRSTLISSVQRFVSERLREVPLPGAIAAAAKEVNDAAVKDKDGKTTTKTLNAARLAQLGTVARPKEMSELVQQFELYCVAHGFELDDSIREPLHEYLSARHVMVQQSFVRRIIGLRWLNPHSPLEPRKEVREEEMPPELKWDTLWSGSGYPDGVAERARSLATEEEDKRSSVPKKKRSKEGKEYLENVPVQYGGQCGHVSVPLPVEPLPPVEGQQHTTQFRQSERTAFVPPSLQRAAPALPIHHEEKRAAPPTPREYAKDHHGQLYYDEYGHPLESAPAIAQQAQRQAAQFYQRCLEEEACQARPCKCRQRRFRLRPAASPVNRPSSSRYRRPHHPRQPRACPASSRSCRLRMAATLRIR